MALLRFETFATGVLLRILYWSIFGLFTKLSMPVHGASISSYCCHEIAHGLTLVPKQPMSPGSSQLVVGSTIHPQGCVLQEDLRTTEAHKAISRLPYVKLYTVHCISCTFLKNTNSYFSFLSYCPKKSHIHKSFT